METITVIVGSLGATLDGTRQVQFEGERLAIVHHTDTTETLYRDGDGRLLVYVQDWSQFKDGPAVYTLHEVTEQDVGRTGRYAQLGREAGLWRPDGGHTWGPEGPVCQQCGTTLAKSAMPTYYDGEEPVYLCWDCEKSRTIPTNR